MPNILTDAAIAAYQRDGYYFPVPVMPCSIAPLG